MVSSNEGFVLAIETVVYFYRSYEAKTEAGAFSDTEAAHR